MKKRVLSLALAMSMTVGLLAGCSSKPTEESKAPENSAAAESQGPTASGEAVKIAVAAPMTGDNAEYGQGFYNAATMMADEWNAKGGVLGRPIEIVQYDD